MHGLQLPASLDSYVPTSHFVHVVLSAFTTQPFLHLMHEMTRPSAGEYASKSHLVLVVAVPTSGHSYPFGHSEHSALVPPKPAVSYRPDLHGEQAVWLDSYVPASHFLHVVFLSLTIEPLPHVEHLDTTPAVENVPSSHGVNVVSVPTTGHAYPPKHSEHSLIVPPAPAVS